MNILEKLEKLFSPYDIITLTKEYSYFSEKNKVVDIPQDLLQDAKKILGVGPYKELNPTWFITFGKENVKIDDLYWERGISNLFRLTTLPVITDIDNDKNHVSLSANFVLFVINALSIPQETYKGLKCEIKTAMGNFTLEEQD